MGKHDCKQNGPKNAKHVAEPRPERKKTATAGVQEFWLVDARGEDLLFRIHRRGPSAFEAVETDAQGCQYSTVLDCHYRLDRARNQRGHWTFDLREEETP